MKICAKEKIGTENGSQPGRLPELRQPHVTIKISEYPKHEFSKKCVELYKKGLSVSEIGKQLNKPKSTVRDLLVKVGVKLRPVNPDSKLLARIPSGKTNMPMPFGFCYFQGQIVPNQQEFTAMILIHRLWKSGTAATVIAKTLNDKKIRPRKAKLWNRNSINKILARISDGTIVFDKNTYGIKHKKG